MGVPSRVREYQPVVHRLRLSASPSVPTHPGRISLAQEPLVFRRGRFSLPSRYSCLHSHSRGVHGWIPPPLHPPRAAPLPPPTPGHRSQGSMTGCCGSATASAVCLSPATLSARNHLTSELLRTLSRMAASKPTSWLSLRSHILFHLAHA